MRQRRLVEARLNRGLGELLGTARGAQEVLDAIDELESVLRSLAAFARNHVG